MGTAPLFLFPAGIKGDRRRRLCWTAAELKRSLASNLRTHLMYRLTLHALASVALALTVPALTVACGGSEPMNNVESTAGAANGGTPSGVGGESVGGAPGVLGGASNDGTQASAGGMTPGPSAGAGGQLPAGTAGATAGGSTANAGGPNSGGGEAGAAGMNAGGGAAGASSAAPCAGADILCTDFESEACGSLPTGGKWLARPEHCAMTGSGSVATGEAVSGSQHFVTVMPVSDECSLKADLGEQTEFWVRARVRFVGTAPTTDHEVSFFELGANADKDDPEGRIGYRADGCNAESGANFPGLEFNMTVGPGGEFTGCTGVQLEADRWYCIEAHLDQSGPTTVGRLFLDNVEQAFTNHGKPVPTVIANDKLRYLKVGKQSYGGSTAGALLLDDVAVSTTRLGCK